MALVQSLNVTPNDNIDLNTVPPSLFIIQFEVHNVITDLRLSRSPDGNFFWEERVEHFAAHETTLLEVPHGLLITETGIRMAVQQISNVLEDLNIAWANHWLIIQEIHSNMVRLENESWENWGRIRPILVEIGVVPSDVNRMDDDELIWVMEEEGEAVGAPYKAASRSSIEELEKASAGLSLKGSSCSVCLEEFEIGTEVARMPCSHYYHTECIVEWLEKSNLCPLCRFQMPVAQDY